MPASQQEFASYLILSERLPEHFLEERERKRAAARVEEGGKEQRKREGGEGARAKICDDNVDESGNEDAGDL
eukprot:763525-Hanusia_phi.AAC.4